MSVLHCDVCERDRPVSYIGRAKICNDCRPELMAEIDSRRAAGLPVSAIQLAHKIRDTRREVLSIIETESAEP